MLVWLNPLFIHESAGSIIGDVVFHGGDHPGNNACEEGGYNTYNYYRGCVPSREAIATGAWGFAVGQEFDSVGQVEQYSGYSTSAWVGRYVPYTGYYKMRLHLCYGIWGVACTISNSGGYYETAGAALIQSSLLTDDQNIGFTGFFGPKLQSRAMACITLVDDSGREWGSDQSVSCHDAPQVPTIPATCYLNERADLNVDMGSLERSKISTALVPGAEGNVIKSVPVICTRDAGTTVSTTFQFTPISVNGSEVVSTSTANLGVAIYYQGQLVGPTSAPITETFEVGYTDRELEFQAVRDPNVETKEIPTGGFTASAIMVMTEQ